MGATSEEKCDGRYKIIDFKVNFPSKSLETFVIYSLSGTIVLLKVVR